MSGNKSFDLEFLPSEMICQKNKIVFHCKLWEVLIYIWFTADK